MTDASAPPPQASIVYEVREQIEGALLPAHDYAVTGQCATGTGLAAASTYAQGSSGRGAGLGAGVGGRAGYLVALNPPTPGRSTWWGLRFAAGLDLGLLYARVDTGIPSGNGQLCERLAGNGLSVQYQGSTVLLAQISLSVGAQLGLGESTASDGWHGVLLGAAIVPAFTYVKPWVADSSADASILGIELSLDFATMANGTAQESGKRLSLFLLLPPEDRGAMVTTLGFGIVWF